VLITVLAHVTKQSAKLCKKESTADGVKRIDVTVSESEKWTPPVISFEAFLWAVLQVRSGPVDRRAPFYGHALASPMCRLLEEWRVAPLVQAAVQQPRAQTCRSVGSGAYCFASACCTLCRAEASASICLQALKLCLNLDSLSFGNNSDRPLVEDAWLWTFAALCSLDPDVKALAEARSKYEARVSSEGCDTEGVDAGIGHVNRTRQLYGVCSLPPAVTPRITPDVIVWGAAPLTTATFTRDIKVPIPSAQGPGVTLAIVKAPSP
jgi:hypothetical protein